MITRKVFYDTIRQSLLHVITEDQVITIDKLFDYWECMPPYSTDTWNWYKRQSPGELTHQWLAYILATCYHETAHTFKPIREFGQGRDRPYGTKYYGRGLVQLTWEYNYARWAKLLGIDLLGHPDLALDLDTSITICIRGMIEGRFTGHRLSDYDKAGDYDFVGARHVVNGTDRAELIAGYARLFEAALKAAVEVPNPLNPKETILHEDLIDIDTNPDYDPSKIHINYPSNENVI